MKSSLYISVALVVIALVYQVFCLVQRSGIPSLLIGAVFIILSVANLVVDLRRERR